MSPVTGSHGKVSCRSEAAGQPQPWPGGAPAFPTCSPPRVQPPLACCTVRCRKMATGLSRPTLYWPQLWRDRKLAHRLRAGWFLVSVIPLLPGPTQVPPLAPSSFLKQVCFHFPVSPHHPSSASSGPLLHSFPSSFPLSSLFFFLFWAPSQTLLLSNAACAVSESLRLGTQMGTKDSFFGAGAAGEGGDGEKEELLDIGG